MAKTVCRRALSRRVCAGGRPALARALAGGIRCRGRAHAAGTTITAFYPTTRAVCDRWGAGGRYMPPPRAHVFAAGIASIPIILRYARARRGPALQVTVCNATGAAVASTTIGPVARPGTRLLELTYQCHAGSGRRGEAYPDGTYQAVLVAEGVAVRTFSFTVGG